MFHEQFKSIIDEIRFPNCSSYSIDAEDYQDFKVEQLIGEDPWMMIYTGGTTGISKGVVLSADAVNSNAMNTIISWGLTEEDITIKLYAAFSYWRH